MSDLFCEGASAVLEGSGVEIGKEELAHPVKANRAMTTSTAFSPYVSLRFSQKFFTNLMKSSRYKSKICYIYYK